MRAHYTARGTEPYVIQAVAKAPLMDVARGVVPFLTLMIFTVVLLYLWTDSALFIPFKL